MRRIGLPILLVTVLATACGDDTATTTTTEAPTTTVGIPGSVPPEIAELIAEVERLRGLEFLELPTVTIVTPGELAGRVREKVEADLDTANVDAWQALYELLGLLDGTVDLRAAYRDLYAEQVGAFYEPESRELVVGGGPTLGPLGRSLVVHELVHALTDQHFGFAPWLDELQDAGRYDEALALHAFIEGEATFIQLTYLQGLPLEDQLAAVRESLDTDTTVLESLPSWFAEDLTFPYDAGFRFVARLVETGGMDLLDQAYRRLPETTEQILHPGKYFTAEPARPVELVDVSLPGYEVVEEGTWGAWNLRLHLLDGLPDPDRTVATGGWGGDRFRLYRDGDRVAFAYLYEGDTPLDAGEVADALRAAAAATMGLGAGRAAGPGVTTFDAGAGFAQVRAGAQRVLFVAASDPGTGALLAAGLAAAVDGP
jgi:hypothetical protein